MLGFHWPELFIIVIVALIIFGPKRLPEIGGALGKGIKEFRKGTSEIEEQITGHSEQIPAAPTSEVHATATPGAAEKAPETSDKVG
jgi:sec-independent protein translocase protein TatA